MADSAGTPRCTGARSTRSTSCPRSVSRSSATTKTPRIWSGSSSRRRRPAGSATARCGQFRLKRSSRCALASADRMRYEPGRQISLALAQWGTGAASAPRRRALVTLGDLVSVMTTFAADRGRRTTETDRWLAGMLGAEPGVALVAVGGYGRKELLPGSDLDVLLLHDGREGIAKIADRVWYPVWDSGARLDHAVRTVPQARRVARSDLKVALGLLNARHVAGDPDL